MVNNIIFHKIYIFSCDWCSEDLVAAKTEKKTDFQMTKRKVMMLDSVSSPASQLLVAVVSSCVRTC